MAIQTKTMKVKSDTALAETTTTIRDTVTFDTSKLPNGITYKGLKAVLSFADPIQWNKASTYDALTVVWDAASHGSYVSKRPVPANIELTNEFYWLRTADLDAQVEIYRQEVMQFDGRITANTQAIAAETARAESAEEVLSLESVKIFNTVNALKKATNVRANETVMTAGFSEINDGGGTKYIITANSIADNVTTIPLDNGMFATIVYKNDYAAEEFGMDKNDCSAVFNALIKHFDKMPTIRFGAKTYAFNSPIILNKAIKLIGQSGYSTAPKTVFSINGDMTLNNTSGNIIEDIDFKFNDSYMILNNVTLSTFSRCEFNSNTTALELKNLCAYVRFIRCAFSTNGTNDSCVVVGRIIENTLEYIYFDTCNFEGGDSIDCTALQIIDAQYVYLTNCDIAKWEQAISIKPTKLSQFFFFSDISIALCNNGIEAIAKTCPINQLNINGNIVLTAKTNNSLALKYKGNNLNYVVTNTDCLFSNSGIAVDYFGETEYTAGNINCRSNYGINKKTESTYKLTANSVTPFKVAINDGTSTDVIINNNSPINYIPMAIISTQPATSFNYSVLNTKGGQLKIHIETSKTYTGYVNGVVFL